MSKIKWKGGALTAPIPPVLVTCSDGETDNVFTVAWTGITCTHPPKTYISVRPERFSYDIIKKSGEFAINLSTESLVGAVDFCGIKSGKNIDKFKLCGLEKDQAFYVSCPIIRQSPLSLECSVDKIINLGSHDMFLSDIVGISVDDSIIDREGRMNLEKCGLLAFAHGQYFKLGKVLGNFGFSVKKRKNKKHIYK
jgi:flavin reductase (DIM6/NTAB) family NADH-FMN oxidoreductase RutF